MQALHGIVTEALHQHVVTSNDNSIGHPAPAKTNSSKLHSTAKQVQRPASDHLLEDQKA